MAHQSDLIAADIHQYLQQHEQKELLRFITCGSVDDGKSTLIGRLLYDANLLLDDQLASVSADSRKHGTQGDAIDFALLVDGLAAEREQGITIDVAYRFFSTDRRKFIVADTPGHEQYTRNMITGASSADLAVLIVDARKGLQPQTRRHSYLVSLMGIRSIVVAINKMDLVDYSHSRYQSIVEEFNTFARELGLEDVTYIPLSALHGDNITTPGSHMPWYHGTTLMGYLETVKINSRQQEQLPFRMFVQWVNRPNADFRGFCGQIASGSIATGDRIRALPSGQESTIKQIATYDGNLQSARAGQSITLVLEDEIDISRGNLLCTTSASAAIANHFEATLVWMHTEPLLPGRTYLLKIGTSTVSATVTKIKYEVNINTLEHLAAQQLTLNSIGVCTLSLNQEIPFDPYRENRETGAFILIDRLSNRTTGAGLLHFALRRSQNISFQHLDIKQQQRAEQKQQKPCIIWLTGLSGAGKSTIANLVEKKLFAMGRHTYLLDGDNIRHGLNKDLGFTDPDRVENIRRIAEVAKLMVDAGLIVISAFISPFISERRMARELVKSDEFIEVHIDTPLELAEQRDPKGLYKKARRGELKNFTGIDSPYEPPEQPECHINTSRQSAEESAEAIIAYLQTHHYI